MSCPFCEELATGLPPDREGVTVRTREIARTDRFAVLADISPLVPGHLIIIPKAHLLSFGHVTGPALDELNTLVADIRQRLLGQWPHEPVVLEHGTDSSSDGGGCVSHAHLHLVPAPVDFTAALSRWKTTPLKSLEELRAWGERDVPYVFAGDWRGKGTIAEGLSGIPKQFLRIEIARQLGIMGDLWDWRRHILTSNLEQTMSALAQPRV